MFSILWIIIFSRKNCVYSFFCCSFSQKLYTESYPFFQTEALYLLISNLIMEIYPQSDCPMGHFREFAFFLHFCYTFFKKERLFLWRLILYRN